MSQDRWNRIEEYKQQIIDGEAIAVIWSIDDVQWIANLRPVTEHQCKETLRRLQEKHDAEIGINWDVIDTTLDHVLREGP